MHGAGAALRGPGLSLSLAREPGLPEAFSTQHPGARTLSRLAQRAGGRAPLSLSLARRGRSCLSPHPEAPSKGDPRGHDPLGGRAKHRRSYPGQGGDQDPGEHPALGREVVLGRGVDGLHGASSPGALQGAHSVSVQGVGASGGGQEVCSLSQPAAAADRGSEVSSLRGPRPESPRAAAREGQPQRPLRHPPASAGHPRPQLRVQRRQGLLFPPAEHDHLHQGPARHPGEDRQARQGGGEERRQRHPGLQGSYPGRAPGLDRATDAGLSLPA